MNKAEYYKIITIIGVGITVSSMISVLKFPQILTFAVGIGLIAGGILAYKGNI
ncbi:hypothetical protein [Caloranaerobacter sp. DY30410]|uniref:hypothetical protein n=1 Tax=Caloranaerobacter sp. DY30410 TaxID=3238305 RepID=UPI003CFC5826